MDKIIYLLILSHGIHEYKTSQTNEENDEKIYAKENKHVFRKTRLFKSQNVIIPDTIDYIQKITYTPFGLYNIMSSDDKDKIYKNIISLIDGEIKIGESLTELVKNEITFETIESKLSKSGNPEYIRRFAFINSKQK